MAKKAKAKKRITKKKPVTFKIDWQTLKVSENEMPKFTPAPLALCGQLEDSILLLKTRISNAIAKINSLM